MIRFISLLVSIPVIVLIAAFTYKNAQLVSIDLFLYQINLPLAIVILISLLVGVALGFLLNIMALINQRKKFNRLIKKKEALQGLSGVLNTDK